MKLQMRIVVLISVLAIACTVWAARTPRQGEGPSLPATGAAQNAGQDAKNADAMRVEGERRFRANCSRCHAAPHRFPPRMMATIVRHMRVRATITDEDMRLILFYMTE
jgi:cytochrome c5